MKKSTRIVKKSLALFLVVLMSINTFAAVVGDNDGAAFITKAEFDSLKNDFQSQLDRYNSSIDNKIDGAIASYLASLNVAKKALASNTRSVIAYPLNIYMTDRQIVADDVTNIQSKSLGRLWSNYFNSGFVGHEYSSSMHYLFYPNTTDGTYGETHTNAVNKFYNGKIEGTKFVIDGMNDNYEVKTTIMYIAGNFTSARDEGQGFGLLWDHKTVSSAQEGLGSDWDRSSRITDDFELNYTLPNEINTYLSKPELIFVWATTNYCYFETDVNKKKWNRLKLNNGASGFAPNTMWTRLTSGVQHSGEVATYKRTDLTEIINAQASTSSPQNLIPVTYDNEVKVTNVNNFKTNLLSAQQALSVLDNNTITTSAKWLAKFVITPGLTIEPEYFGKTSRSWTNKSLIDPAHCVYKVTLPYTGTVVDQNLTKGILITEANYDIDEIEVDLTPTWNTTDTIDRYILMSKSPIELERIVSGTNTNNFLKLKIGNETGKYVKLKNGIENKITINTDDGSAVMLKGELLYFKILWDVNDGNRTYPTTITEPKVYFTN